MTINNLKIAIASGKGGTGKTLVSTNLFWTAQRKGLPVTIIDCDAEEPNAAEFLKDTEIECKTVHQQVPTIDADQCWFCGKCYEYCSYNAILFLPADFRIQVIEDLCHDCGACTAVCEYNAITEKPRELGTIKTIQIDNNAKLVEARAEVGIYSPVPIIKQAIVQCDKQVAHNELLFLDSPPGISCPFIATVETVDYVVLVTEPTPFGLNDLKLSVETLQKINKPFGVIINRAGLGNRAVYEWLEQNTIELLMEIPFNKDIARTYSVGKILVEHSKFYYEQFDTLLTKLTNQ